MNFLSTKTKAAVILGAAVLLLALGFISGRARENDKPLARDGGARLLDEPLERPTFVLSSIDGEPFEFAARTEGKTALLFFGFLNCPDICPIHLSTIASALREMPAEEREQVMTVFVTVDPDRDTPEAVRAYLDRFDPAFIGLTGTHEELAAAQRSVNLPVAELGEPDADGNYDVGHAAVVIAFEPDGPARRVYPFGATQEDWKRDLPAMVRGELSKEDPR